MTSDPRVHRTLFPGMQNSQSKIVFKELCTCCFSVAAPLTSLLLLSPGLRCFRFTWSDTNHRICKVPSSRFWLWQFSHTSVTSVSWDTGCFWCHGFGNPNSSVLRTGNKSPSCRKQPELPFSTVCTQGDVLGNAEIPTPNQHPPQNRLGEQQVKPLLTGNNLKDVPAPDRALCSRQQQSPSQVSYQINLALLLKENPWGQSPHSQTMSTPRGVKACHRQQEFS